MIGTTVSHYRVLERLGGGGMGVVYKAWDLSLERFAALKLLHAGGGADDTLKRRFLREARTASMLDHPNICAVYEAGETADRQLYIAMAFCNGESLEQALRRGPLPLSQAIEVGAQVAAGLDSAHARGVMHRDVKPPNVMLVGGGRAVLVDFGIACLSDQTRLTRAGDVMGTAAYLAPELLLGGAADARSDIWSLGVVLYEMVTGGPPYRGADSRALMAEILGGGLAPMADRRPGVPPELDRITARALARRPADRWQRAGELGAALRDLAAAGSLPPGAFPVSPAEQTLVEMPANVAIAGPAAGGGIRQLVGHLVSHYRVLELLGGGGMGVVYKAEDTRLGRAVALKFLPPELTRDPDAAARFMQEARAASALDHPNICTVYEVAETESGQLFFAMPFYDGETLKKRLARGRLPLAAAVDFALQTARGLAKAHRQGIVHRDVKPANLMITGDDLVKIVDFGIAKLAGTVTLTHAGASLGTPGYMSPEQARGDEIDARTDLWSLGAVLYEMVTGRRPFGGDHVQAALHALLYLEAEPLARLRPETPPELERIAARLLAKDPGRRYQSAAEVIADLQALGGATAGLTALATAATPPPAAATDRIGAARGGELAAASASIMPAVVERRQLTALRCEVVPAAAAGGALDPDDLPELLHELMPELDRVCAQAIARFEGHIARRFASGGLLVFFGTPLAHEDDSRRAVRAALEIREAVRGLGARLEQEGRLRLAVRAGIHSGLVVGAAVAAEVPFPAGPVVLASSSADPAQPLALGEAPAAAEALLGLAEPGAVVVSEATQRLIAGFFDTERLGAVRLPGSRREQDAYRVVRDSGAETRFQVELRKGLTPLVGRGHEIALTLERWAEARAGRGQVVMVSAEAGIGKSRLIEEIRTRLGSEPHLWLECRCSPYHQNSAFYPLIGMFAAWLRLDRQGSPGEQRRRLESCLAGLAAARDHVIVLAALLGVAGEDETPALERAPGERRQATLEVVTGMVLEEAQRRPVAFVVEDLPWADPSTLEWLGLLLEQVPTAPILALLAFRPEFEPPAAWRTHASRITLGRLNREQVTEMIGKLTGGKALPPEVAAEVFRKTEGVPLFVEDLTRMVIESGLVEEKDGAYALKGPFHSLAIPETLQEALLARLERLQTARAVAQLGATIGREFSCEMLRELTALDAATLARELDRLVAAGLLYRRGLPRNETYVWKHALIQEALAQSLLKRQRRHYHKLIAEALARSFPEITANQPEIVAHHWTEAGETAPAVDWWTEAARHALQASANVEAVRHAAKGLALLAQLPAGAERDQRELQLHTLEGSAQLALTGWASAEYRACIDQALAVGRRAGASPELFAAQIRLGQNLLVIGRLGEARDIGKELLSIAAAERYEGLVMQSHALLCAAFAFLGEHATAQDHAMQGLALYDLDKHHPANALLYGQDPATIFMISAVNLWQLGACDRSRARSRDGLLLADRFSHAFSRGFLLCGIAWNYVQMRDHASAAQVCDRVIQVAREHGFANLLAWGGVLHGAAVAGQGRLAEGIALMTGARADWHAGGAEVNGCFFPCLLAEACLAAGRVDEAQAWVDQALHEAPQKEERNWWAEVHRLKGELLCRGGAPAGEVKGWLEQAQAIARGQGARSLELRAAMSLARLARKRGARAGARQRLAQVYGGFTEGFDTPDLVAARELLAELG